MKIPGIRRFVLACSIFLLGWVLHEIGLHVNPHGIDIFVSSQNKALGILGVIVFASLYQFPKQK